MTGLKSKLRFYLLEKNEKIKKEYITFINSECYKNYRDSKIKCMWLLFRLNWHYRVLHKKDCLLPEVSKVHLLKHIGSCVHKMQIEDAVVSIQKYIKEYDNNLETICCRLGISVLLDKLCYKNPEIAKGMELYNFFQKNDVCNLKDYFSKNKSIAIVGNSGRELGKNKGAEIDSHDIVIRFNNFPAEGYEKDYGVKTNVWVRNTSKQIDESRDIRKFDYVVFDPHIRNIWYDRIDAHLDWTKKYPEKIKCIPYKFFKEKIVQDSGIHYPTLGLMIIYILAKCFGLKNIDVYGFSFLDEDVSDTSHYYDDLSKIDSSHREFKAEQEYLRTVLGEIK